VIATLRPSSNPPGRTSLGLAVDQSGGSYTESERVRPARAGARCRGNQGADRDVYGTCRHCPEDGGPGSCDSHITGPIRGRRSSHHYGARGPTAAGSPESPAAGGGPGTFKWAPCTRAKAGPAPGRWTRDGRGRRPWAAPQSDSDIQGQCRVTGRGWARGRMAHKPPSGRGPGGVGTNPGSSVYSRAAQGRDPGRQPTQGSVVTRRRATGRGPTEPPHAP
jgi:hypothetical protein